MQLSLKEALEKNNGELSIDQFNSLLPQTLQAVLAIEGASIGEYIGDWELIEDSEGHRGFRAHLPGILLAEGQQIEILQLEPGLLSICIFMLNQELSGVVDFREKEDGKSSQATNDQVEEDITELTNDITDQEIQTIVKRMENLNLIMSAWMLNQDLFDFLAGQEV